MVITRSEATKQSRNIDSGKYRDRRVRTSLAMTSAKKKAL